MFTIFYNRICEILDLGEDKITRNQAIILALAAYLFGVLCRSFYLWNALDVPSVLLNGVPMISTEDGYLFADYVNSHLKQDFSRGGVNLWQPGAQGSLTAITLFLVKILPFKLEQVAVFMPMIFPPLLAVPLLYAGRFLGSTTMGLFAALIGTIALPYLKRTSFAYYDTDLFALFAPAMVVALGIYAIKNPGLLQILWVAIMVSLARWLDKPQIADLMYAAFAGGYILANFRNPQIYSHILLLCLPMLGGFKWQMQILYDIGAFGILFLIQKYAPPINLRIWQAVAGAFLLYTIWQSYLYDAVRGYVYAYGAAGRGVGDGGFGATGWNFYQVSGTIVEARSIDLLGLSREVSGHIYLFWLGFFGSILALVRYPALAIGGFFLGVGLFSLEGGIRFSLYLVPILAIGSAYLALLFARYLCSFKYINRVKYLNYAVAALMVMVVIYPGWRLAYNYSPRSVAQLPQVEMLQRLDEKTQSSDYLISWWDYGYVMSFYADMKNIINGAKHHQDNFIVSKAFSSTSPRLAANIIRESVEAYEQPGGGAPTAISRILGPRRDGFNPEEFINSMAAPTYQLQRNKTREIYFYVPYQMLPIYGVVRYFSDLNIDTGKIRRAPLITTRNYRVDQEQQRILLPDNTVADLKKGVILQRGQPIGNINTVFNHQVSQDGSSRMLATPVNSLGYYYIILSGYYGIVYLLSPEAFRANFIQMFFFNNYDPELFELVERNTFATIYKLKI